MVVKAELSGHEFDLEDVAALLPVGPVRITVEDGKHYLIADEIDNRPPGIPFYEVAPRVLRQVNGLARAIGPDFRPVSLTGRYMDSDRPLTVVHAGTAEIRIRANPLVIGRGDGTPLPPPPQPLGPWQMSVASSRPEVAEALTIMGQTAPLGWVELYKVFEIVRHAVKPADLAAVGLATKDELSAFGASANRPDVSGQDARHSRMSGPHPKRTMTIGEGRAFVGALMTAWIDSQRP
ncbi:hypothetical protein [Asanoa iriomotensis]|uniref:hypothetical protein n=1 Tax=Asanoa iriomotensis TaxID=234613 RepID=UPI00194150BD|nr:hypothetical protein [Asanoa iriomotensis]